MDKEFIHVGDICLLLRLSNEGFDLRSSQRIAAGDTFRDVCPEFNPIVNFKLASNERSISEFSTNENVNLEDIIVFQNELFDCALEHEDVANELKQLMSKVIRYTENKRSVVKTKANLKWAREIHDNVSKKLHEKKRQEHEAYVEARVNEYSRKIRENDKAFDQNKIKFIAALNNALEHAGSPDRLTGNDAYVWEKFVEWGWAGHDGYRYCCYGQNIMLADDHEFNKRFLEMFRHLCEFAA